MLRARSEAGAVLNVTVGQGKAMTVKVPACADWTEVSVPAKVKAAGKQDITVELASGAIEIDWVSFR